MICTSPNYAAGSKALSRVAPKLRCVPIGVEAVIPNKDGAQQLRKLARGRKIVFSLGRMIPYKGFDNLILAARELPDDYMVIIAGSGPLYKRLKELVHKNGLGNKVIMPGRISDKDRDALLGVSSVFVLPSVEKTEAYGIVLIEAMSAGVPVIATEIPGSGTSWVNEHGVSGLNVPVGSPGKLAEAIVKVCGDTDIYGRGARRRWETMFTGELFIDNITSIYRELLEGV